MEQPARRPCHKGQEEVAGQKKYAGVPAGCVSRPATGCESRKRWQLTLWIAWESGSVHLPRCGAGPDALLIEF